MMTSRSTYETIEDLRLLLKEFDQLDPAHEDASLAALQRILRDRIAELEAFHRLLATADAMHDMTANGEK